MKKGFTFIELVIVLGIFVILFSVGINSIYGLNGYKEKLEVKNFMYEINSARSYAISHRKSTRIALDENSYTVFYDENGETHNLPNGMSLNTGEDIVFTNRGRASKNTPRTVIIKGKNKNYTLTIQVVSGKVELK